MKEFAGNPNVVALSYDEGGRNGETRDWLETFWDNYYLRGSVLWDAGGENSRQNYGQLDTGLPFGRGFVIDRDGRVVLPYFGHQPEEAIRTIYALLGGSAESAGIGIPHVTGGAAGWRDVLSVDNLGTAQAGYTVILYDASSVRLGEARFTIGPHEYRTHELKSLAPEAVSGRILSASPDLNFRVSYEHLAGRGVAEFNLTAAGSALLALNFANSFPSVVEWKGIAVMNMGALPVPVTLYAIGGGQARGVAYDSIPPNAGIRGTHDRWFPALKASEVERIMVVSEAGALTGVNLSGNAAASLLLFAPAVPVAAFVY